MNWNLFQSWSLKTKVTLVTLVIFLFGVWSLALYANRILRDDMRRQLGEQQFSIVSLLAAHVDEELNSRLRALEMLAGKIDASSLEKPAALQKLLEDSAISQFLFNGGIFVTGPDGTAVADLPIVEGRVGTNYMDRESISVPLREGRSIIGRPAMGKTLKAPVFSITVPVRDRQGGVAGALCGTINLGKPSFLDKITENKYGKTGGYLLIAPQYRLIVTASDKSRIMEELPAAGVIPVMDRFNDGYEGTDVFVNRLGVELLVSVKRITAAGWNMAAVLPTQEAFAPIHDTEQHMLLAAIALTLLAGGLAWWTTWWMLRRQLLPMLVATRTLTNMSHSEQPAQPLRVTTQDEIGELIAGFNGLLEILKRREEALLESETLLNEMGRTARIGGWSLDLAKNTLTWTREVYAIHEVGEDFRPTIDTAVNFYALESRPIIQNAVEQAIKNGNSFDLELESITARGRRIWVHALGHPVERDGKTKAISGTFRDITDRKLAEIARARAEAQLHESQKMEALGTLAGGVAHDFNNALAIIIGNTELARQDIGPDHPAMVSLEEVAKASRRVKDLVQQILSFGRRQKLERKATSLALVVVETARLVRTTLPPTVSLTVNCDPHAPAVLADATQIKQILLNLCGNAIQAIQDCGRPGAIEMDLSAFAKTEGDAHDSLKPGRYACLRVRDTGSGMDQATRARIFEPFFTTKQVGKGTGLGLSVVHSIVREHEASIEVESALGEGSSFRIYIPAIDTLVEEDYASGQDAAPVGGSGKHVLYIDDEEAIVLLMTRLLERQGYRVSGYTDPEKALAEARANPGQFDLVVTDYSMPRVSGLDVARALKRLRADLPVVLASGYITEELRANAPEAGVSELIYKPNTVDELCAVVARVAHEQSGRRGTS